VPRTIPEGRRDDNLALGVRVDWEQVLGNDRLTVHGRTLEHVRRAHPDKPLRDRAPLWGVFMIFGGVHNLFDYVQQGRHPDDAAFIFAPYTGRIVYGGPQVKL
jgi:hypothetical protein